MVEDFKRALARIQSDYDFYVDCQTNPASALAGYDLTDDERIALTDSARLTETLGGVGVNRLRITFSGTHDWVNRTGGKRKMSAVELESRIAADVAAVRHAATVEDRRLAVLRLIEAIG